MDPRRIAAITLCVWLLPGQAPASDAHVFCEMQWASAPDARAACVSAQINGAQFVARYLALAKSAATARERRAVEVYAHCRSRWAPDYDLTRRCIEGAGPKLTE